jgi:hypothetical protein
LDFEALTAAGATFTRHESTSTSSFTIQGIPISQSSQDSVRFDWTLPRESGLHVLFVAEKLGKKIVKLFKSELQVGDAEFDKAVYIDTKDKEATATFLKDEKLRSIIMDLVAAGGKLAVDGATVHYEIVNGGGNEEAQMATFIGALLGQGPGR